MTKDELDAYDYASMRKQDERGKTTVSERKAEETKTVDIAKKGIQAGCSNEIIRTMTGLSDERINEIREQINGNH